MPKTTEVKTIREVVKTCDRKFQDKFSGALFDTHDLSKQLIDHWENKPDVHFIVSARDGLFRIADESDAGEAHRIVAVAMAAHEYVKKLSSRSLRGSLSYALEGKRMGGAAPYGMDNDEDYGLKPGPAKAVRVVRRVFHEFVNEQKSINAITAGLNRDDIPAARGKEWFCRSVQQMLSCESSRWTPWK